MQKVGKLNSSIDIIPLQGSSGTLRPKNMDSKKYNVNDQFKRLGRDQILISRVQKYMHANEKKIYIDVIEMADHLQNHYRDYGSKKRGPFRAMVRRAYDELSEMFANKSTPMSTYNEDDEDDEIDLESDTRDDTMSDLLLNMYKKSQGKQNGNSSDKELIDISSDDDNSKQESKKKEEQEIIDQLNSLPNSQTTVPKDTEKPPLCTSSIDKTCGPKSVKEATTTKREREKTNDGDQLVPFKKMKRLPITNSKITFADVGGNDKVLRSICKLLTHMRHPEIFKQLGISPPRGFLLHGPPGCGKTLLAHAIAGELDMPLLKVAAPELVAGVSGESESRIRELFEQAVAISPCILFLDEIDAVLPHRATAQREMERRIVAQLLSCLDDLNSKENGDRVLVIGATNRPDALDPALRRAGRFDREVSVGIPDKESRVKIIQVHTTKVSLAPDINLNSIAQLTPGYVGADLVALIREAAMIAVERVFESLKQCSRDDELIRTTKDIEINDIDCQVDKDVQTFANSGSLEDDAVPVEPCTSSKFEVVENETHSKTPNVETNDSTVKKQSPDLTDLLNLLHNESPVSSDTLANLYIEYRDFEDALKIVQPSAKREGFVTVPDVTWNDVGSLQDIRQELQMAILAPIQHSEHFSALGLISATGVLLCGPPGCGKTLLAKAIANEAGINFISVKGPELLNMYVGESEKAVRQCFARARNSAPCVIFFDELDALCPRRTEGDNSVTSRVVNQMLTEMDGVEGRQGVFVMAASNRPDIIDPAILRPGRLDKILYVGLPLPVDRVDILKALTKDGTKPKLASDVDLEKVGNHIKCESYTGADLASLIRESGIEALKELMDRTSPGEVEIGMRHILSAFEKVRPSVQEKDIKNYEKLKKLYSVVKNTDVTPMETPVEIPATDPIVEAMET